MKQYDMSLIDKYGVEVTPETISCDVAYVRYIDAFRVELSDELMDFADAQTPRLDGCTCVALAVATAIHEALDKPPNAA
jgi:hypothetical protein